MIDHRHPRERLLQKSESVISQFFWVLKKNSCLFLTEMSKVLCLLQESSVSFIKKLLSYQIKHMKSFPTYAYCRKIYTSYLSRHVFKVWNRDEINVDFFRSLPAECASPRISFMRFASHAIWMTCRCMKASNITSCDRQRRDVRVGSWSRSGAIIRSHRRIANT